MNSLKASIKETESKISVENEKLEGQKSLALQKTDGVRIESKRNKSDLKNIIDKAEKILKQRSREDVNIDDVKKQLDDKIEAYSATEAIVNNLTNTLENVRYFF